jgi:hypothetical protein
VELGSQRFTFRLVKLRLDGFRAGGLLFETSQAFLFKGMDRITHRLGSTAQIAGDFRRTLLATGREEDLTSTQGKGIRGT